MQEQTMDSLPEVPQESIDAMAAQEEQQPQEQQPQEQQQTDEERNLVNLRKAKEAAEKERDAYYKRLQSYEQQQKAQEQPQQPQSNPWDNINDDDLAEGRHLKAIRQELNEYKRTLEQTSATARLHAQYPDMEKVVTAENIEKLNSLYPELARTIGSCPDHFSKAAAAYTTIKKFGIYEDTNHAPSKERIVDNTQKPRPMASISPQQGESPLSHANAFANGLTPDLKKKLFKEMMESRR